MSRIDPETVGVLMRAGMEYHEARKVLWHARRLHRLAEACCNRELTEREEQAQERSKKFIRDALGKYGIGVTFQGDPRGHVVIAHLPDGRSNRFAGEGWGIA